PRGSSTPCRPLRGLVVTCMHANPGLRRLALGHTLPPTERGRPNPFSHSPIRFVDALFDINRRLRHIQKRSLSLRFYPSRDVQPATAFRTRLKSVNVVAFQIHKIHLAVSQHLTVGLSHLERSLCVEVTRAHDLVVLNSDLAFKSKRHHVPVGMRMRPYHRARFHSPMKHIERIATRITSDECSTAGALSAVTHLGNRYIRHSHRV